MYPAAHDYSKLSDDEEILNGYLVSFRNISTTYEPLGTWEQNTIVKGIPVSKGIGNAAQGLSSIGLLDTSEHKDEAWEFIRCFLLADGPELGYAGYGFSINKTRFEADLKNEFGKLYTPEEMELYSYVYMGGDETDLANWAQQLINSVSRVIRKDADIQRIVSNEVPAYFDNNKTEAELIEIIESKIGIYVDE